MPQAFIARGEKFSTTTSAHFTRRSATSRASGTAIFSARPSLPALTLKKPAERSRPALPSLNGWPTRSASTRMALSSFTTVAP